MAEVWFDNNKVGPFDDNGEIVQGGIGPMRGTKDYTMLCPKCNGQEFHSMISVSCALCGEELDDADIRSSAFRLKNLRR